VTVWEPDNPARIQDRIITTRAQRVSRLGLLSERASGGAVARFGIDWQVGIFPPVPGHAPDYGFPRLMNPDAACQPADVMAEVHDQSRDHNGPETDRQCQLII